MVGPISARGSLPAGARRGREDGYNLVVLVVMITVLNILIAKALPLWSAVIQREKEEELIFRGMQYAEAIRVYEKRTGGLPTKLEQLIETEPRCIRQLWTNPLAQDGSWELVLPGQGQRRRGADPNLDPDEDEDERRGGRRRGDELNRGRGLPGDPSQPDQSLLWIPGGENQIGSVPIFGVKSSVGGTSMKTFVVNPNAPGGGGSNEISEWLFTVELAKALIIQPDPANPLPPSMNVEQRFRPWPPGIRPVNVPMALGGGGKRNPGMGALENPGQANQRGGNRGR